MKLLVSPEHARLTLQADKSSAYVVYCLLRRAIIADNGSSHFTKKEIMSLLAPLNFSARKWTRIFKAGNNVYWNCEYRSVYLRSYHKVTKNLEALTSDKIDYSEKFCRQIELEITAQDTSASIASKLYFSWFLARGEVTIARATIQDLFGISPDRQRHYESLLDGLILIKSNYAHIDAAKYAKNPQELPQHHFTFGYERFEDDTVSDIEAIQYQLPNTFLTSSGNGQEMPTTTDASNSLKKAIRARQWHTESYCRRVAAYSHTWREFERSETSEYVRSYYNGKKRLWLSRQYL